MIDQASIINQLSERRKRLHDLLIVRNYDIIYIFMWVTPLGTSFFERAFRILAKYVIYDIAYNVKYIMYYITYNKQTIQLKRSIQYILCHI